MLPRDKSPRQWPCAVVSLWAFITPETMACSCAVVLPTPRRVVYSLGRPSYGWGLWEWCRLYAQQLLATVCKHIRALSVYLCWFPRPAENTKSRKCDWTTKQHVLVDLECRKDTLWKWPTRWFLGAWWQVILSSWVMNATYPITPLIFFLR